MLLKDQGLIHEIVTSVSYVDGVVWVATYFGESHYDGRYWHNFLTKDSGLPRNFTNFIKGRGSRTGRGLAPIRGWRITTGRTGRCIGQRWTTGKPEMTVRDAAGHVTAIPVETAPAHNYVLGIDFQGRDIWVATAKGLSHGIYQP